MRLAGGALVMLLSVTASSAQGDDFAPLEARYAITGTYLMDAPPGQKKDRLAVVVTGASAQRIYEAMPGKPASGDACETGMLQKRGGGLECVRHSDGAYECAVGIMLASGQTKSISMC